MISRAIGCFLLDVFRNSIRQGQLTFNVKDCTLSVEQEQGSLFGNLA
jgi:hypothetical protein